MTIEIALPLRFAVIDGMIVRVAQETYVTPISAIVECIRPARIDIRHAVWPGCRVGSRRTGRSSRRLLTAARSQRVS